MEYDSYGNNAVPRGGALLAGIQKGDKSDKSTLVRLKWKITKSYVIFFGNLDITWIPANKGLTHPFGTAILKKRSSTSQLCGFMPV